MPEWLNSPTATMPSVLTIVVRLLLAWLAGCGIAWLASPRRDATCDKTMGLTLILMSILIAMATQIIGDNIARAFSLVGALSIVRFRTAVSTAQDVAFVLASVVLGMSIGAGQYVVAILGFAVVVAATIIGHRQQNGLADPVKRPNGSYILQLRATLGTEPLWLERLPLYFASTELISVETARKGTAISYEYQATLNSRFDAVEIINQLSQMPQIESVSLQRSKKSTPPPIPQDLRD